MTNESFAEHLGVGVRTVPLLREPHPQPVRREIFSAAAEVARLPGCLSAKPVIACLVWPGRN